MVTVCQTKLVKHQVLEKAINNSLKSPKLFCLKIFQSQKNAFFVRVIKITGCLYLISSTMSEVEVILEHLMPVIAAWDLI